VDNLRYLVVKPAYPQSKTQFSALNTPTDPLSMKKYEEHGISKCHESVDEYFERMVRENA